MSGKHINSFFFFKSRFLLIFMTLVLSACHHALNSTLPDPRAMLRDRYVLDFIISEECVIEGLIQSLGKSGIKIGELNANDGEVLNITYNNYTPNRLSSINVFIGDKHTIVNHYMEVPSKFDRNKLQDEYINEKYILDSIEKACGKVIFSDQNKEKQQYVMDN